MSITISYNKNVGIHYVYETTYEWDEEKQKKVQRSRCIGHLDPETQEIVPNGKRGRPRIDVEKAKEEAEAARASSPSCGISQKDFAALLASVQHIDRTLTQLIRNFKKLGDGLDRLPPERRMEAMEAVEAKEAAEAMEAMETVETVEAMETEDSQEP